MVARNMARVYTSGHRAKHEAEPEELTTVHADSILGFGLLCSHSPPFLGFIHVRATILLSHFEVQTVVLHQVWYLYMLYSSLIKFLLARLNRRNLYFTWFLEL